MLQGRAAFWFLLVLLTLLAALTLWIERAVQPPAPKQDGSARHDPDYMLTNFTTTKTDRDGNLRSSLSAAQMWHYPDDDSTRLERPKFALYTAGKLSTSIEGDRGEVASDGKNVYFMDNVKVVRVPTRGKGELTVLTDYLHIVPDEDIAKTDRPVSILQAPRTVIRGTGMIYNKKQGTLQLMKNVRVHYEKPGTKLQPLKSPPPPGARSSTVRKQNGKSARAGGQTTAARTGD